MTSEVLVPDVIQIQLTIWFIATSLSSEIFNKTQSYLMSNTDQNKPGIHFLLIQQTKRTLILHNVTKREQNITKPLHECVYQII